MIHPTSQNLGPYRPEALAHSSGHTAPTKRIESAGVESLSTAHADSLQRALESSPEIRPEMVELGQALAIDPNYPPRHIIDQLAKMFTNASDPSELA